MLLAPAFLPRVTVLPRTRRYGMLEQHFARSCIIYGLLPKRFYEIVVYGGI